MSTTARYVANGESTPSLSRLEALRAEYATTNARFLDGRPHLHLRVKALREAIEAEEAAERPAHIPADQWAAMTAEERAAMGEWEVEMGRTAAPAETPRPKGAFFTAPNTYGHPVRFWARDAEHAAFVAKRAHLRADGIVFVESASSDDLTRLADEAAERSRVLDAVAKMRRTDRERGREAFRAAVAQAAPFGDPASRSVDQHARVVGLEAELERLEARYAELEEAERLLAATVARVQAADHLASVASAIAVGVRMTSLGVTQPSADRVAATLEAAVDAYRAAR